MRKIEGYFYINSGYVNSTKSQEFEYEFDDSDPEEIIEAVLEDGFNDFMSNVDSGWVIKNDTKDNENTKSTL